MPNQRLSMRKIKEILRLKYQAGLSHRQIARSCGISHTTVSTWKHARKRGPVSG
jgi:DNA-binding transcriptional regulator LsrR (DeoR family)